MSEVVLELEGACCGWDDTPVVRDLDLRLRAGTVAAMLGPNGAGKSTTLRTIAGDLDLLGGRLRVFGQPVPKGGAHALARLGVALVPDDRGLFYELTVRDNLQLSARGMEPDIDLALTYFPVLRGLLDRPAGVLSGGEQQMLALGRALARRPRLLLVDEASLGLAPVIVQQLLPIFPRVAAETGAAILFVEQHVAAALAVSDEAHIMIRGRLALSGSAEEVASKPEVIESGYLAGGTATAAVAARAASVGDDAAIDTGVLIVGAGPVGLSLALDLQRRGIRVRIIDEAAEGSRYSKASVLHVRPQELLEFVGARERMLPHGHPMRPTVFHAMGNRLGTLDVTGVDSPFGAPWIIFQSEIERELATLLAERGLEVERLHEFLRFEQDADGVTTWLRGPDGKEVRVRSRWMVGCDGSGSRVRKLAKINFEGRRYEEDFEFQLGDVRLDWSFPPDVGASYLNSDGAICLIVPQLDHHRIVVSKPRDDAAAPTGDADEIRHGYQREPLTLEELQELTNRHGPRDAVLRDPIWLSRFGVNGRLADEFRVGRVLIAGDAAHIHVPLGGQGMNTGLGDAFNLGWKLALVDSGEAKPELLDTYYDERHPVAADLVRNTDQLFQRASKPNRRFRFAARFIAPRVFPRRPIQNKIRTNMAQFNVNYRESTIVDDERPRRHHGPAAGERAPDFEARNTEGEAASLFGLLRSDPRSVLVMFASERADQAELDRLAEVSAAVEARAGRAVRTAIVVGAARLSTPPSDDGILVDESGDAARRYGTARGIAYLVRPDGYIGYAGPADGARIIRHLDRVLQT